MKSRVEITKKPLKVVKVAKVVKVVNKKSALQSREGLKVVNPVER